MRMILIIITLILCSFAMNAQYTTDKVMGDRNQALADSLRASEYPYLFPIWGKKVVAKGFNIPKSAGMSVQYVYQQSDILINNLMVGFNNGPMNSLDQIVRIDKATATTNGVNIRPDVWILPFLNVYAIFAKSKSSTAINAGIWLPDSSNWHQVSSFSTKAEFDGTTFGFGITPTAGIRGYFFALDMNCSWTDIAELEKPAFVFIVGPRIGKNISLKRPNQSIALWAGGFRVKMASTTSGSINLSELFPTSEWNDKLNTGYAKLDENQKKVDTWWNSLTPTEQKKPKNVAKHEAATRVLTRYSSILEEASQAVDNLGNGSVQYSLEKKPKDMWNFLIGSQFQLNRSWMLRAEAGFLGTRTQFIAGLQYRFNF